VSPSYQFTNDGTFEVTLTVTDNAGHQSVDYMTVYVVYDTAPPETTVTGPPSGSTIGDDTSYNIDSTDETGVALTEVFLDGELVLAEESAVVDYILDPTTVDDGQHTLEIVVTDIFGQEQVTVYVVFTDTTAPEIQSYVPPECSGPCDFTVDATDETGIDRVEFWLDGELRVIDYTDPYVFYVYTPDLTDGEHTLEIIVYDTVGNYVVDVQIFVVDNTPPVLNDFSQSWHNGIPGWDLTISASVTDFSSITSCTAIIRSTNGFQVVLPMINIGSGVFEVTWSVPDTIVGNFYIDIQVIDNLGNVGYFVNMGTISVYDYINVTATYAELELVNSLGQTINRTWNDFYDSQGLPMAYFLESDSMISIVLLDPKTNNYTINVGYLTGDAYWLNVKATGFGAVIHDKDYIDVPLTLGDIHHYMVRYSKDNRNPIRISNTEYREESPQIILSSWGTFYMVYTEAGIFDLLLRTSSDGLQWNTPIYIEQGNDFQFHSADISQTPDGMLWIVVRRMYCGSTIEDIYILNSTDGVTWSEPRLLVGSPVYDNYPKLAVAPDGSLWVLFSQSTGYWDLYIMNSTDGIIWSDPRRITDESYEERYGDLTIGSDGSFHVIYHKHSEGKFWLYETHSYDGITWSEGAEIVDSSYLPHGAGSIVQMTDGSYLVLYRMLDSGAIYSSTSQDGISWSTPTVFYTSPYPGQSEFPDILVTPEWYQLVYTQYVDNIRDIYSVRLVPATADSIALPEVMIVTATNVFYILPGDYLQCQLNWFNIDPGIAQDVEIVLEFSDYLEFVSSSYPVTIDGNQIILDIDQVDGFSLHYVEVTFYMVNLLANNGDELWLNSTLTYHDDWFLFDFESKDNQMVTVVTEAPDNALQTSWWWKNEFTFAIGGQQSTYDLNHLQDLVTMIAYSSELFSGVTTVEQALSVLILDDYKGPKGLALRDLYGVWLNLANDALTSDTIIDLGDLTTAGTVGEVILECESILLIEGASAKKLLKIMRICQEINAGRY
jgi:hypothetical protein